MSTSDKRLSPRYQTVAHAQISGILGGDCFLRNISVTGCGVECTGAVDLQKDIQYQMKVKPEKDSHIGSFDLQVECKWIRNSGYSTELGFCIIASPKGRKFQRYVDYLAYRHSHG
jgi:hypothetical protein